MNLIHPGSIETGLTRAAAISWGQASEMNAAGIPLAPHIGDPEDIGYGLVYLASDESKFVTGEERVLGGGLVTH